MWYWTYRIPDLSVTEHVIFWTYVSDTKPFGYWTYQILSILSNPAGSDTLLNQIPRGLIQPSPAESDSPASDTPQKLVPFTFIGMVSEPTESDTVGYKNPWNLISRNLIIRGIRSRVVWYTLQIRSYGVWYPQESDPTTEKNPKGTTSEFKYLGEFLTKFENI